MDAKYTHATHEFIQIPGYEGRYSVSEYGLVRNDRTNKIIGSKSSEYVNVTLSKSGKAKKTYAHRIVAEVFVENPDNKPHVNHIDGNKRNNHYSNLEWVTSRENIRHSIAMGLFHANGNFNQYTKIQTELTKKKSRNMLKHSFKRGYGRVPHGKIPEIRSELMSTLNITSKGSWFNRLNGKIEPKVSEVEAIEAVFAKYGVKKTEIWG